MRHTGITSRAVDHLIMLPKLTMLDLSRNRGITEEVIHRLAGLQAVEHLDLSYTPLSSNGAMSEASVASLAQMNRIMWLHIAGTGADTRLIKAALPQCDLIASDANEFQCPELVVGVGFRSVLFAVQMYELEIQRRMSKLRTRESGIPKPWPMPELLGTTVARMIALAQLDVLDPKLRATRPLLEDFAARLQKPSERRSAKEFDAFLNLAGSNEAVMRLYTAASSLVLADGLAEHLDRLEHEKQNWALTDVELNEFETASKYLVFCLNDAAEQLHLFSASSSDERADAVRPVWEGTRATTASPPLSAARN